MRSLRQDIESISASLKRIAIALENKNAGFADKYLPPREDICDGCKEKGFRINMFWIEDEERLLCIDCFEEEMC